jgi:DNA-binding beta-propeller fold protein YncE
VDRDEPPVVVPMTADAEGDEELVGAGFRPPRWLVLAAIALLVAGALTALALKNDRHPSAAPTLSPSPTPSVIRPAPQGLADLSVQDLAINKGGELYVLTSPPDQLVAVNQDGLIRDRAPAPAGAQLVVANPTSDLVWVIVPQHGRSDVFIYAGSTMTRIGKVHVPATVAAAAALGDQLWMATDHGIYRGWPGRDASLVPGYTGPVQEIVSDPLRVRLLAVSKSYDLITVDNHAAQKVLRFSRLLPKSIAVTDDGTIWLVGFGQQYGSRVGRLDPHTLGVTLINPTDLDAPRGAIGWSGGSVFWIQYADSGSIVCLDGRTGQASASYPKTGTPVVSVPGVVYATRGNSVVRLHSSSACPG